MRMHIQNLLFITALLLSIATIISAPHIDNTVNNPYVKDGDYILFYARCLPITYYISIPLLVISAFSSRNRTIRILSVFMVITLIELLPSRILVNPWLPDQYPYLSEPMWIYRNGHIANIHYLAIVPGLGLTFSQLMLVTGMREPFILSRYISPFLASLILLLATYAIGKTLRRERWEIALIAILIFLAVNFEHINIFHRNTLFFIYYQFLMLSIIQVLLHPSPQSLMLFILFMIASTLTYPGTVILLTALAVMFVLIVASPVTRIFSKMSNTVVALRLRQILIQYRYPIKTKVTILLGSALVIFISWNLYVSGDIYRMVSTVVDALRELMEPVYLVNPYHAASGATLTPAFKNIINFRLIFGGILLSSALIIPLFQSSSSRESDVLYVMYIGHIISIAPLVFSSWGLWALSKFLRYLFYLSSILIAYYSFTSTCRKVYLYHILLILYIITGLVLLPVTRYASLPYLTPSTEEITSTTFIHEHYTMLKKPIYYTEYPPYIRALLGYPPDWELSMILGNLDLNNSNIMVVSRFNTRDIYYNYDIPCNILVNMLRDELPKTRNLVYVSSETQLFIG